MDSSPLSSGLLPFSFLFLFCFVYRTNTCMSYRINQLDKIWKVVVLLLYFFFCYLVNIKKKFGNFAWFFFFFACFISWQGKHEFPTWESLFGGIMPFYSCAPPPPPILNCFSCRHQSLLVFRSSTIKSFKYARNK